MRINTNIASLQAQRQMSVITRALSRALQRLSSGKRINSASDDASGLAQATGLEAQLRAQRRAIQNLNDSQGLLTTADGALGTQTELVQRMRELAVQSASGILGVTDRQHLDNEFQTLLAEFNRITETTKFGQTNLLDGTMSTIQLQAGFNKGDTIDLAFDGSRASSIFTRISGEGTFTMASCESNTQFARGTTGDFNNDGHADVLTADFFSNTVSTYLGNGDGTLQARVTSFAGSSPANTWTKDFDADGDLDLVVNVTGSSVISMLWNDGSGAFTTRTTLDIGGTTFNDISAFDFGDFNNDGLMDIAAGTNSFSTKILLNQGNQNFSAGPTLTFGASGAGAPVVADFNGDGNMDVAMNNSTIGMQNLYLGDGHGSFDAGTAISQGAQLKAADIDHDGDMDLVGFDQYNNAQIRVMKNSGTGTFTTTDYNIFSAGYTSFTINLADMNGDGNLDALVGTLVGGATTIAYSNSNGEFLTPATSLSLTTGATFNDSRAADFNEDGINDIFGFGNNYFKVQTWIQRTGETSAADQLDISTQADAQDVLEIMDYALKNLQSRRAQIGGLQSRLDFARNQSSTLVENLAAAHSQIMDADIAEETAELVKYQILQQAAASVLAQANFSLTAVLNLLR